MSHRREPIVFAGREGIDPGDEVVLELVGDTGTTARMIFCWCPKPRQPFQMGSPESEAERGDNEQAHWVNLSHGFWLAKHPVNQSQFHVFYGNHKSSFGPGDTWPVDTVSWDDAKGFCQAANRRLKIGGWRMSLPTEAQWEYACRAGRPMEVPFATGGGRDLHAQLANFDGNHPYGEGWEWLYREATLPEGAFPPNAWGLHDLHGQLWEWCEDAYAGYPETRETGPALDPGSSVGRQDASVSWVERAKRVVLPQKENSAMVAPRVLRGGSWGNRGWGCRAANRGGGVPASRRDYFGFRPVLVPLDASEPAKRSGQSGERERGTSER